MVRREDMSKPSILMVGQSSLMPPHTAWHAGRHQAVEFLAVSVWQITNNGARFRT